MLTTLTACATKDQPSKSGAVTLTEFVDLAAPAPDSIPDLEPAISGCLLYYDHFMPSLEFPGVNGGVVDIASLTIAVVRRIDGLNTTIDFERGLGFSDRRSQMRVGRSRNVWFLQLGSSPQDLSRQTPHSGFGGEPTTYDLGYRRGMATEIPRALLQSQVRVRSIVRGKKEAEDWIMPAITEQVDIAHINSFGACLRRLAGED